MKEIVDSVIAHLAELTPSKAEVEEMLNLNNNQNHD